MVRWEGPLLVFDVRSCDYLEVHGKMSRVVWNSVTCVQATHVIKHTAAVDPRIPAKLRVN